MFVCKGYDLMHKVTLSCEVCYHINIVKHLFLFYYSFRHQTYVIILYIHYTHNQCKNLAKGD